VHIIVFKIMLETVYWNWLSVSLGIVCMISYYATVVLINVHPFAIMLQPQIDGEFWLILKSVKAWVCLIVLPAVALLPDVTYVLMQKIFWPTPTDAIMLKQQRDPNYQFEGFNDVYVPPFPSA